ncbi:MAG: hypothetical protein CVU39_11745 [Chloroflexi bacterium HGW-Chloroflexi-10]|nr:MAG: hypothetical protein CVU39_11745 [Chloroflexi bacterium HGW-Chloroflexi-10]
MSSMILLLACAGIFVFFILLFGFLLLMRYINYKENVKMADGGIVQLQKPKRNRWLLVVGWIGSVLGVLLSAVIWVVGIKTINEAGLYPLALGPWMLIGLAPLFFGLCMLLIYVILAPAQQKAAVSQPPVGEPWANVSQVSPQEPVVDIDKVLPADPAEEPLK